MRRFQKSHLLAPLLMKTFPKGHQSQQNTRVTGIPIRPPWLVSLDWNVWQTSRSIGTAVFRLQKHTPADWCDSRSKSRANTGKRFQPRVFSHQHTQHWGHVWQECVPGSLSEIQKLSELNRDGPTSLDSRSRLYPEPRMRESKIKQWV